MLGICLPSSNLLNRKHGSNAEGKIGKGDADGDIEGIDCAQRLDVDGTVDSDEEITCGLEEEVDHHHDKRALKVDLVELFKERAPLNRMRGGSLDDGVLHVDLLLGILALSEES